MIENPKVVAVDDAYFSFGETPVLGGICFGVALGEMLAIVGPNGAGKTTLLKVISGLLKVRRGSVLVNGQDIHIMRPRERARLISVVSQNPQIPEGFTALEIVLMGRNAHLGLLQWEGPRDIEIALAAMECTGTVDLASRLLTTLSGGERQRVFIARAVAQDAALLILDEPTAHLDIGFQSAILDTIERIRLTRAITVIAAMHDLTLASQYCDRMAILYEGRIAAVGRPSEVMQPEIISTAFDVGVRIVEDQVTGAFIALPLKGVNVASPDI